MQKSTYHVQKMDFLSITGWLVSLLVLAVFCGFMVFLGYSIESFFLFLDAEYYLGWIAYGAILGITYSRFAKGGENILSALLLAIPGYIIVWISYYVSFVLLLLSEGESSQMISESYGLFTFLEFYFTSEFTIFESIDLSGITAVAFNLIGIVVATIFLMVNTSGSKTKILRKQQHDAVAADFLRDNAGADISSPFVRARMWTEQGLKVRLARSGRGPAPDGYVHPGEPQPWSGETSQPAYPVLGENPAAAPETVAPTSPWNPAEQPVKNNPEASSFSTEAQSQPGQTDPFAPVGQADSGDFFGKEGE